jgi:hypothetical protein
LGKAKEALAKAEEIPEKIKDLQTKLYKINKKHPISRVFLLFCINFFDIAFCFENRLN